MVDDVATPKGKDICSVLLDFALHWMSMSVFVCCGVMFSSHFMSLFPFTLSQVYSGAFLTNYHYAAFSAVMKIPILQPVHA